MACATRCSYNAQLENLESTCANAPGGIPKTQTQEPADCKPAQHKQHHCRQPQVHWRTVPGVIQPAHPHQPQDPIV